MGQVRTNATAAFKEDGTLLGICGDESSDQVVSLGPRGARNKASTIGDSRSSDVKINAYGTNSKNWFIQACGYYKAAMELGASYGVSGNRTDQYLTNGNLEKAIDDESGVVVFGYPVVNDISQAFAGYTDTFGRGVGLSNVVDYAIGNLTDAIKRVALAGKRVVVLAEPGSTSLVASQVALVHEFNRKYRDAVLAIPGVIFYSANHLLWDQDGSATLITFRTNYTSDGTHFQQTAARAVGKDFAAKVLPLLTPAIDTAVASASEVIANGVGQLFANPLFTTLTGGSSSNITVSSGNVPGSVAVSGSSAGLLSVAITSAANADGFGNDVTFAFTASGSVSGRIDLQVPSSTVWELTDYIQGGVEYDLAPGSNASVYLSVQLNDNTGTRDVYACYSGASGPASAEGESGVVLRSMRETWNPAATSKGYLTGRIFVFFPAAGTATVTIRRGFLNRYR